MIAFHRFLISTAIVFCGIFALWSYLAYDAGRGKGLLVLSVAFAAAGAGLAYYLVNLKRFLKM